jgi:hypothetical protein
MLLCAEFWEFMCRITITDEMPNIVASMRTNFWPSIYSIGNFLSISLQEKSGLRNVFLWLHRMDSFSLLMDVLVGADLVPAYSLTF